MKNRPICSGCGIEASLDAERGLCGNCLFALALFPSEPSRMENGSEVSGEEPVVRSRLRYFGDYELIEEIARGGMGIVFKARQVSLNRIVALKAILSGDLASVEERERFRKEAEGAAGLQHPNIVAIHEIGHHEGRPYFSMDYVEGRTLAQLISATTITPARAAAYVEKIAAAVHYAHQRGILHRDLKPQNILIDQSDEPRITDFGVAKRIGECTGLTRTDGVLGTPNYMSPEQAAGRNDLLSPRSDVYSVGAILYELLTGKKPFRGETPAQTIIQVIEQEPVAPRSVNPIIARELETICLKALQKDPARRYQSSQALGDDLGRFLRGETILACSPSKALRAWNWTLRNPWSVTGLASLLVVGLFALCFGLWQETRLLAWKLEFPGMKPPPPFKSVWIVLAGLLTLVGAMAALLVHVSIYRQKYLGKTLKTGRVMVVGTVQASLALVTLFMTIAISTWQGSGMNPGIMWLSFSAFWYGAVLLWHGMSQNLNLARGTLQTLAPLPRMRFTQSRSLLGNILHGLYFGATVLLAFRLVPNIESGPPEHSLFWMRFSFCGVSILAAAIPGTIAWFKALPRPILLETAPLLIALCLLPPLVFFGGMPTELVIQSVSWGLFGALLHYGDVRTVRAEPLHGQSWENELVPMAEIRFYASSVAFVVVIATAAMFFVAADGEAKVLFVNSVFWLTLFGLTPGLAARYAKANKRKWVRVTCVGYGLLFLLNLTWGVSRMSIASSVTSLLMALVISVFGLKRSDANGND